MNSFQCPKCLKDCDGYGNGCGCSKQSASDCSSTDVEKVYKDFWQPIIEHNGVVNMEHVKKELFDFWQVMQNTPKVYRHVTGDLVSKILTDADVVCNLADEHYDGIETYCSHCACQSCEDARKKYEDKW